MKQKAICIYGASSADIDPIFTDAARCVGRLIALSGHPLVSGGGISGVMGAAIEGALDAGGETIGVLPRFMVDNGWGNPRLSRVIVTPDMHSRKRTMAEMSAALIALPGGCGTIEELMEAITWRQLNLYGGNVVIANIARFYDPLIEMLSRCIDLKFMRPDHRRLWAEAPTAAAAVALALEPAATPFPQKINPDK